MPALRRFNRFWKRPVFQAALVGIGVGLAVWIGALPMRSAAEVRQSQVQQLQVRQPQVMAQVRIRTGEVWQQIYQQLPDLPLENQYVSDETGEVSTTNTLLNRLIRYHIYVKGRPTFYRLDWKLTLADYLGANERILPETYPSGDTLRTNPLPGDITAVNSLTRQQRDELVDLLFSSFNPGASAEPTVSPAPSPVPSPLVSPAPAPASRFPQQSRPGDAQLLQP